MTTRLITNAHIVDPAQNLNKVADLAIEDDKILAVGTLPESFVPETIIDGTGKYLFPGLIDLAVNVTEKNMAQEAAVAAQAGVTSMCCGPTISSVIDAVAEASLVQKSRINDGAKIYPVGALSIGLEGEKMTPMVALKEAGCIAFSNGTGSIKDTRVRRRCFEYAASFDLLVLIQAADPWLAKDGCVHEGMISTRLGLPAIPAEAESMEIARCLQLIELTGVRAHFSKISAGRSLDLIAKAKAKGLPITADVAIHHLWLTDMDVVDFNSVYHVQPPLRSSRDRQLLREGLREGVIDAICSDHCPVGFDGKMLPFQDSVPGIAGIETLLPLSMRLVDEGLLSYSQLIEKLSTNPAKILDLPQGGQLSAEQPADLLLYDPNETLRLTEENIGSSGHNTPFMHWDFNGAVTMVMVDGSLKKGSLSS